MPAALGNVEERLRQSSFFRLRHISASSKRLWSSSARTSASHLPTTCTSCCLVNGLDRKSSMPASRQRSLYSLIAEAVRAMMGIERGAALLPLPAACLCRLPPLLVLLSAPAL